MEFVLISPGKFMMGLTEGPLEEQPTHEVTINQSFYLGVTPVTQRQWKEVMGTEPWRDREKDNVRYDDGDYPAVCVSWVEANEFIRKLNQRDKSSSYRLPTEAEWEYAARAGTNTRFSFDDEQDNLDNYGWYKDNASDIEQNYAHRVRLKLANPWGLYDMHGNVWEWCQDYKHQNYEGSPKNGSAWTTGGEDSYRVVRGGGFDFKADGARSAYRNLHPPNRYGAAIGFRLVRKERID